MNWDVPTSSASLQRCHAKPSDLLLVTLTHSTCRGLFLSSLVLLVACRGVPSWASEYEVVGSLHQTIRRSGVDLDLDASFTVYVRGCGWLIETLETNKAGGGVRRQVGSTNQMDIFECVQPLGPVQPAATSANNAPAKPADVATGPLAMICTVVSNSIPVGQTELDVVGHLWLMFASQCFWPNVKTDRLSPIYDWRASVAAEGQNVRIQAGWNLLSGSGSLPSAVWYLGSWGETNALYRATGTNSVGGILVPMGFTFEQLRIGGIKEGTVVHAMEMVKRVDVTVTAARPECSRLDLIPAAERRALIVDRRIKSDIPGHLPSYQNPLSGRWPTFDESRDLAKKQEKADLRNMATAKLTLEREQAPRHIGRPVVLVVLCVFLAIPLLVYIVSQRRRKS